MGLRPPKRMYCATTCSNRSGGTGRPRTTLARNGLTSSGASGPPKDRRSRASNRTPAEYGSAAGSRRGRRRSGGAPDGPVLHTPVGAVRVRGLPDVQAVTLDGATGVLGVAVADPLDPDRGAQRDDGRVDGNRAAVGLGPAGGATLQVVARDLERAEG